VESKGGRKIPAFTVKITGTPAEIGQKLERLRTDAKNRAAAGYDPTESAFKYEYNHAGSNVCAVCLSRAGEEYSGNVIHSVCPNCVQTLKTVFYVNEHDFCQCELTCKNAKEACAQLLSEEINHTLT
jgi:hypothetical protein